MYTPVSIVLHQLCVSPTTVSQQWHWADERSLSDLTCGHMYELRGAQAAHWYTYILGKLTGKLSDAVWLPWIGNGSNLTGRDECAGWTEWVHSACQVPALLHSEHWAMTVSHHCSYFHPQPLTPPIVSSGWGELGRCSKRSKMCVCQRVSLSLKSMMPADVLFSRAFPLLCSNCQTHKQRRLHLTPPAHCHIGRFPRPDFYSRFQMSVTGVGRSDPVTVLSGRAVRFKCSFLKQCTADGL